MVSFKGIHEPNHLRKWPLAKNGLIYGKRHFKWGNMTEMKIFRVNWRGRSQRLIEGFKSFIGLLAAVTTVLDKEIILWCSVVVMSIQLSLWIGRYKKLLQIGNQVIQKVLCFLSHDRKCYMYVRHVCKKSEKITTKMVKEGALMMSALKMTQIFLNWLRHVIVVWTLLLFFTKKVKGKCAKTNVGLSGWFWIV